MLVVQSAKSTQSWTAQAIKLGAGRSLICSLSAFSLAKEEQVNDNAYQYYGHDNQLLQVSRIKGLRWNCPQCGSTMTAMMIDD
jgi:hypothetical protein